MLGALGLPIWGWKEEGAPSQAPGLSVTRRQGHQQRMSGQGTTVLTELKEHVEEVFEQEPKGREVWWARGMLGLDTGGTG